MIFTETGVLGAFAIAPERIEDERGFFARSFSATELTARGLDAAVAECSVAFNRVSGTLRGLHYQRPPHAETKLVRCTRGAVYDVVVDLRPDSPSYLSHAAVELSAENRLTLYVPRGCAHGYLTLSDGAELTYLISSPYVAEAAAGVRWDDPAFRIAWPSAPRTISPRDAAFTDLNPYANRHMID
jgi:dTDP-4-dehydrorhamnose 3,5-epimerase